MADARIVLAEPPWCLRPGSAQWPRGVDDLDDAPSELRVAGRLVLSSAVAMVGTRRADPDACEFAYQLAGELALGGRTLVSGGARGIDAAVHLGALDAGGSTVAVLATGLATAYPRQHAGLFARIAREGALVSEFGDGQSPRPGVFLKRNRLIAAMSEIVVIIQAPMRSGALSTAAWAKRLGRPLMAAPAAPWEVRGAGCLKLLSEGAAVCTSARDVLSVRPCPPGEGPMAAAAQAGTRSDLEWLGADEREVVKNLGRRPSHPDGVARRAGLPIDRVQAALIGLLLKGLVEERIDGSYARAVGRAAEAEGYGGREEGKGEAEGRTEDRQEGGGEGR